MAIVEIGTFSDVYANTDQATLARTNTQAGHLIVGSFRCNASINVVSVTCPGESPVIAIEQLNPTGFYMHCQYYFRCTTGGTKNITVTLPQVARTGHYVAEYSGNFNVSNVLVGAQGATDNSDLTITAPAGALSWGLATGGSTPNVEIDPPPFEERVLITEWSPNRGAHQLPSAAGDVTFRNLTAGIKTCTFVVYQEDAGGPTFDHKRVQRAQFLGAGVW